MKLLVVSPSFPDKHNRFYGGIFVKEQVEVLSKYADEINVVSPVPFSLGREYKDKVCKDYSFDNVNVYFPRFLHLPLGYFRKRRGEREARVIEKLIQKKNIEFDLIHAHFTWPSGYAGAILKSKYGVPLIITAHGYDVYDLPFRKSVWFEVVKTVLNSVDRIITVSNSNFRILTNKLGISDDKIFVIPNGFNPNLFKVMDKATVRKQLVLPQDKIIILNVASLVPEKGHRYLIEAMKEIVKVGKDILCVIVGDGKLKDKLKKQSMVLNLENYIKFIGAKPHHEIPLWMNACDLFVLPSLSESFGIVQIEAMACGKPVVATRNGGSEEIIISEDYGLLCEPADPEDLAEKILIALDREWDGGRIREYAERFVLEDVVKKILNVYLSLFGGLR